MDFDSNISTNYIEDICMDVLLRGTQAPLLKGCQTLYHFQYSNKKNSKKSKNHVVSF